MKAKCNINTKEIVAFKRSGDFEIVESDEIVIDVDQMPNLELDRLNDTNDGIDAASQADIDANEASIQSRITRDNALEALFHDFGDGRIMQTRYIDESNIRNAIELMTDESISSIDWVMIDNIKYPVSISDLQAAFYSTKIKAKQIWDDYTP